MDSTASKGDELRRRMADKATGEVPHALHKHHRERTAEEKAAESLEDAARVSLFTKPLTTLYVFCIILKDRSVEYVLSCALRPVSACGSSTTGRRQICLSTPTLTRPALTC